MDSISREETERVPGLLAEYEVIVAGAISERLLQGARTLRTLVVPFSGVPRSIQEMLPAFPSIRVVSCKFNSAEAAEHAWALLLAAAKRIVPADAALRRGCWEHRFETPESILLEGKQLLLIGYGGIGRRLARFGGAFGMSVRAVKRTPGDDPEIGPIAAVEDLDGLLPGADALILSLPDTPATRGLISADRFARMKDGVVLVNVGRGPVLDEESFHEAMRTGKIGAAGLDVWWSYPGDTASTPPSRFPLHEFPNLVMSPHRASHVREREMRRYTALAEILRDIAAGREVDAVDRDAGY